MEDYAYLHPLSVGELLDRAIRLYRKNFVIATWIAAAMSLPALAVELSLPTNISPLASLFGAPLIFIMTGALVYLFGQNYLSKTATFKDSLGVGWKRFWTILGASFIRGLAIGVPIGILAVFAGLIGCGAPVLMIIFVPIAIYIGARWSVTDCAIILENLGAGESLSRSWELTKLSKWRVIGISLAISALVWLLAGLPTIFFTYFSQFLQSDLPPRLITALGSVVGTFGRMITSPLSMATYVVLFYDLRIRHEGFDLYMQAQTEEPTSEQPAS